MAKKYKRKCPDTKYLGKIGAPKGGRVHWFLFKLNSFIDRRYTVDFDYNCYNYVLRLKDCKKGRADMFLILRTPKTWSVRYYDEPTQFQEQTSYTKVDTVIDYIFSRVRKKIEQENIYEQEQAVKELDKQQQKQDIAREKR